MKRRIRRQLMILWFGLFALSLGLFAKSLKSGVAQQQSFLQLNSSRETAQLLTHQFQYWIQTKIDRARLLFETAKQKFDSRRDQIRFLENQLKLDPSMLSFAVYQKDRRWTPRFQISRPLGHFYRISLLKLSLLNQNFPLNFSILEDNHNAFDFRIATLSDQTPLLRVAKRSGKTLIIGIDLLQETIRDEFGSLLKNQTTQVLIVNREGQLLFRSDDSQFEIGEDLSHLPILQNALSSQATSGSMNYHILPSTPLMQASFFKKFESDLIFVVQSPFSITAKQVNAATHSSLWVGLFLFLGIGFIFGFAFEIASKETIPNKANPNLNPIDENIKDAA